MVLLFSYGVLYFDTYVPKKTQALSPLVGDRLLCRLDCKCVLYLFHLRECWFFLGLQCVFVGGLIFYWVAGW